MTTYLVINSLGYVIGIIANSKEKSDAQNMAKRLFDEYFDVRPTMLTIPLTFQNCSMDLKTASQFVSKEDIDLILKDYTIFVM